MYTLYGKEAASNSTASPETRSVMEVGVKAKDPLVSLYRRSSLKDKVSLFQQKAEDHIRKQSHNPFSGQWDSVVHKVMIDKKDPNYGRPVKGSKTEARGIKAHQLIDSEVKTLCGIIQKYGALMEDGCWYISFGELFQMYTRISSKIVGILLTGRKHGYLDFEGEILFQRQDDHVPVKLIKMP